MGKILENLHRTLAVGLVLAIIVAVLRHGEYLGSEAYWASIMRWIHVFTGILWIGLLYYFNFVQIPTMPTVPAELKPGVSKYIAPKALFFFRWAALLTVLTGLAVAHVSGYLHEALKLDPTFRFIGIGMYLALIMAANVWFVIWPNQKKVLGIVPADDAAKASAAKIALIASRTNTMLSLPMLFAMVNFNGG